MESDKKPERAPIPEEIRTQFRQLLTAVVNHELCVVTCKNRDGHDVFAICIVSYSDDGTVDAQPVGMMFPRPLDIIIPPLADSSTIIH